MLPLLLSVHQLLFLWRPQRPICYQLHYQIYSSNRDVLTMLWLPWPLPWLLLLLLVLLSQLLVVPLPVLQSPPSQPLPPLLLFQPMLHEMPLLPLELTPL